jgi:hypothetical protein
MLFKLEEEKVSTQQRLMQRSLTKAPADLTAASVKQPARGLTRA